MTLACVQSVACSSSVTSSSRQSQAESAKSGLANLTSRRQRKLVGAHSRAQVQPSRLILCKAAQQDEVTPPRPPVPPPDPFEKATELFNKAEAFQATVEDINRGGLILGCGTFQGTPNVGDRIEVMIVEADKANERIICSQKQIVTAELIKGLKTGQIVEGKIAWIEAYGAFVDINMPGGQTVSGMIHKSELSWGLVSTPEAVVSKGEVVRCAVTNVDPSRGRVALSLKALKPDPLRQNLETLVDGGSEDTELAVQVQWTEASIPLPGLDAVVQGLKEEPEISDVKLGRQADVQGAVSQDLELWLTKDSVDGHFNVVARAGGTIQEVMVYCSLQKDSLKSAIDRVLARV